MLTLYDYVSVSQHYESLRHYKALKGDHFFYIIIFLDFSFLRNPFCVLHAFLALYMFLVIRSFLKIPRSKM